MARHFDRERALQGRIEAVLEHAVPEVEVLELELDEPRSKVTVYIDSADGIGFEECTAVTHAIHDSCPDYELEVSSPGIERPLRSARSFEAVVGEQVRLRQQGHHRAALVEVVAVDAAEGVTVRPPDGEARLVPFEEIVRCRLVVEDPFAAAVDARKKRGAS